VVAVGVGDQDVRHRLAAHGAEERSHVRRVVGSGIDDGDPAAADDVAAGAREGDRPGIVGDDPAHQGADGDAFAGVSRRARVEGEVICHEPEPCKIYWAGGASGDAAA
jgi:hypothetical protein